MTYEQVLAKMVAIFGSITDKEGRLYKKWFRNRAEYCLQRYNDGSFRVSRYYNDTCGYADWESFEGEEKLNNLLP